MKKNVILYLLPILLIFSIAVASADKGDVYVIPIKSDINGVTSSIVREGIKEAEENFASAIVLDIDTYGGYIHSAEEIKNEIVKTKIPTVSYVNNKAESAGVLISIASEKLYMSKTATIGSAEPIPNSEKILSFWVSVLRDTAQLRERDDNIVASMADKDMEIEGLVKRGKLTNLTSKEAEYTNISDGTKDSIEEIVKELFPDAKNIVKSKISIKNRLASIIIHPVVNTLLLVVGFVGAIVEVFMPGFGLGGVSSIVGFGLFFAGNLISGNGELMSLLLSILGMVLIFIEMLIPGFGITGISGIVLLFTGIITAMKDFTHGVLSLSIAIIVSSIVGFVIVKKGFESPLVKNVVLNTNLNSRTGLVKDKEKSDLVGRKAVALTVLRPSGTIEIDGERMDALTEGEFISKSSEVIISRVVGTKIFVRRA